MRYSAAVAVAVVLSSLAGERVALGEPPVIHRDLLGHPLPAGVVAQLGGGKLAARGQVQTVAFSPDGTRLATVSEFVRSRFVELWNSETGERLRRVPLPVEADVAWMAFSADGKSLLTPQGVVDVASGEVHAVASPLLAVSPGGRLVARMNAANRLAVARREGDAESWSVAEGNEEGRFVAVAFSPQADVVAACMRTGRVLLLDAATGKKLVEPAEKYNGVAQVAFLPDGRQLALSGAADSIALLNVETGTLERSLPGYMRAVGAMAVSPDGRWIAASEQHGKEIKLWNIAAGRVEKTIATLVGACDALAFSADGARLAVGGRPDGGPNLQIYDVATGEERLVPAGPRQLVQQIAFSANSRRLATASAGGLVHLWDTADDKPQLELRGDGTQDLQFSPDGWTLAVAGKVGSLIVWKADTGDTLLLRDGRFVVPSSAARIAPRNDFLAVATRDGKLELVKFTSGETMRSIQAYDRGGIGSLAISPDAKLLATTTGKLADRQSRTSVELWNAQTGEQVRTLFTDELPGDARGYPRELYDLSFSPAGDAIAARSRDGLHLWETATGKHFPRLESGYPVYCFAPNGRFVICQLASNLEVIELVTGQTCLEISLTDSTGRSCSALAVSPDGRLLAVASKPADGVVLFSLAPPGVDLHDPSTTEEMARAWAQLAESDGKAGYEAAWTLAVADDRAVDFLHDRLESLLVPQADPRRVAKLIAELDDDRFEVRQRATVEIEKLGPPVLPQLRHAAEQGDLGTERRFRLTKLVERMEAAMRRFAGEPLRRLRAIGVLERIGTRDAGELLAKLAEGPPTARETIDAQTALKRLKLRLRGP